MSVADTLHLWDEVARLKQHVADLQQSERVLLDAAKAAADERHRFVTYPQLEAGLSLKTSTTTTASEMEKLKTRFMEAMRTKADMTLLDAVYLKKLDLAAFEAYEVNMDKQRAVMEQKLRDLFGTLALQIERDVHHVKDLMDVNEKRILGAMRDVAQLETQHSVLGDRVRAVEAKCRGGDDDAGRVTPGGDSVYFETNDQTTFRTFEAAINALHAEKVAADVDTARVAARLAEMQGIVEATQKEASKKQRDLAAVIAVEVKKVQEADTKMIRAMEVQQRALAKQIQEAQASASAAVAAVDAFQTNMALALQDACDKTAAMSMKSMAKETEHLRDLIKRNQYVSAESTKRVDDKLDAALTLSLLPLEKQVAQLGRACDATRRDVVEMKGPFLTEVRNLKEENGAILGEIRRQQDVSRELVLDYRETKTLNQASEWTGAGRHIPSTAKARPHSVNVAKRHAIAELARGVHHGGGAANVPTRPKKDRAKTAHPKLNSRKMPMSRPALDDDDMFNFGQTTADPIENAFLLLTKSPSAPVAATRSPQPSSDNNNEHCVI
ncbi:Aste57867_25425 [Aphanomyces stellatus]|uniref:Aste57867_25425 protein n=1 Tax=Aphanomyces stellatus TaxID=120398 RepID=A0A485LT06_9STRA|nr:hypothetical protein As57867_025346 [Aphanomyces stellatus]VFU02049.1 Aste57867_25425 [Aphanomyces stellatus]